VIAILMVELYAIADRSEQERTVVDLSSVPF
jgi:hypothetical protein